MRDDESQLARSKLSEAAKADLAGPDRPRLQFRAHELSRHKVVDMKCERPECLDASGLPTRHPVGVHATCDTCSGSGLVYRYRAIIPDFCPDCFDGRRGLAMMKQRENP